jgi:hypothetical protein
MILLITDPTSIVLSDMLSLAVINAGFKDGDVDVIDVSQDPEVVYRYTVSRYPALVKIHDGKVIDTIDTDWIIGKGASTIKGRFTNAVNAYEAERASV